MPKPEVEPEPADLDCTLNWERPMETLPEWAEMAAQLADLRNSEAPDEEYRRVVGEYGVTIGVI